MVNEYAVWDVEDVMDDAEVEELEEVVSYKYDYENNKTVITGSGKSVLSTPQEAYVFWATKCVLTERFAHEAYDDDYGVEFLSIMREGYPRGITESEIKRSIREALLVDSRTVGVSKFRFKWERDACFITFEVESVYGLDFISVEMGGLSSGRIE